MHVLVEELPQNSSWKQGKVQTLQQQAAVIYFRASIGSHVFLLVPIGGSACRGYFQAKPNIVQEEGCSLAVKSPCFP